MASHQDKGYAWVVCAASFMMHTLYGGLFFSIGMFYIMFEEVFDGDSSAIALAGSINAAFLSATGPIAGTLISRFGERKISMFGALITGTGLILSTFCIRLYQLYITFGIITGIGLSLQCISAASVLSVHFDKRLGLAAGIAASGCGVGSFLFPYLIKYLTDTYNWQGCLLICGACQFQSILCGALYGPKLHLEGHIQETNKQVQIPNTLAHLDEISPANFESEEEQRRVSLVESDEHRQVFKRITKRQGYARLMEYISTFKSPVFTLFCFAEMFFIMSTSIVYTHIGNYVKVLGYTDGDAALLFLTLGISNTLMRLFSGLTVQVIGCHPLIVCLSILPLGLVTSLFSLFTSLPLLLMYAAVFGMLICPLIMLQVVVLKRIVSPEKVSIAIGLVYFFYTPGDLSGAPIAGWLYDTTGIYIYSFYLASGLMVISGTLIILCVYLIRDNSKFACGG